MILAEKSGFDNCFRRGALFLAAVSFMPCDTSNMCILHVLVKDVYQVGEKFFSPNITHCKLSLYHPVKSAMTQVAR